MALNRPGSNLGGADEFELFLEKFGGEVLATFEEQNKFLPLVMSQQLRGAESASFPVIGQAQANWHVAGQSVLGNDFFSGSGGEYTSNIVHTEKKIYLDNPLLTSVLVNDLDQLMNHYDYRSQYTREMGRSLAVEMDRHIISTILAAAEASENISGVTGRPTVAASDTLGASGTVDDLVASIYECAQKFDEVNVTPDGRMLAVRPATYYKLAADDKLVDREVRDFGQDYGKGTILRVAGFEIVKTNNMLTTDQSAVADSGARNDVHGAAGIGYNADFSKLVGLAFTRECMGTVRGADISMERARQTDRLADLMVASYVAGHGVLRPECAISLKTVAASPV